MRNAYRQPMDKYHYLSTDLALGLERGETFKSGGIIVRPDPKNPKFHYVVENGASKTRCISASQAAENFIKLVGKPAAQAAVRAATQAVQDADKLAEMRNERALEGGNLALTREEAEDVAQCERDYAAGGAAWYVRGGYAKPNPVYRN